MSTYTDLHTRRRENVTILRNPGSQDDGITPQRVIFANPENIYEGTFNGKINAVSVSFTSVDLSDVTIHGGTIEDAAIKFGAQTISMTALTTDVSEISGQLTSVRTDVDTISGKIDSFTSLSDLTGEGGSIVVLSNKLTNIINSTSVELSNQLTAQICSISSNLSTTISNETAQRIQDVSALNISINGLNSRLTTEKNDLTKVDNSIMEQLAAVSIDLSTGLKTERDRIDSTNQQLTSHIESSDQHFNDVLSALYRDRHYKIVKNLTQNPYNVEDFAINVIEDYASNVKIMKGGNCIGYGYIAEDEDTNLSVLKAKLAHNDPELINAIPQNYIVELTSNQSPIDIGQQYFYTIVWNAKDNKISLEKTSSNLYQIVDDGTGDVVAYIEGAKFNPSTTALSSGKIVFQDSSNFYQLFKNGIQFEKDNSTYWDANNSNCVEFELPNKFIFHTNAKETRCALVTQTNEGTAVSGVVDADTGISIDDDELQSIAFSNFCIDGYDVSSNFTVQKTEDGLSTKIGQTLDNADIVMSCYATADGKYSASISSIGQTYKYPFYVTGMNGTIINYIQPKLYNAGIDDGSISEISIWFKDVFNGEDDTVFVCSYDHTDTDHVYYKNASTDDGTTISIVNNQLKPTGNKWTVELVRSKDTANGAITKGSYEVDTTNPPIKGDCAKYEIASIEIDASKPTSKIASESSIYACIGSDISQSGEQHIDLNVEDIESNAALNIKLPYKNSEDYSISREFIVLAKIKGNKDQQFPLNLVDNADDATGKPYYSNGKEHNVKITSNVWSALRISEIDNNVFLVEDLDNALVRDNISSLSSNLSLSVGKLTEFDDALSEQFTAAQLSISNIAQLSIPDIWKNIRGGLNYAGTLTISANDFDLSNVILTQTILKQTTSIDGNEDQSAQNNNGSAQTTSDDSAQTRIRTGFFYIVHGEDPNAHYKSGNLIIENGDWLIVKENTILSDLNNDSFDVLDADDSDNFKLSGSNSISGDNIFKGTVGFNCDSISAKCPISIIGNTSISGSTVISGITTLSGQTDIYEGGLCVHDNGISIDTASLFKGSLSCANSICAYGDTIEISLTDDESKADVKIDKKDGVSVSSSKISLSSSSNISVYGSVSCSNSITCNALSACDSLSTKNANIASLSVSEHLSATSADVSNLSVSSLFVLDASKIQYHNNDTLSSLDGLSAEVHNRINSLSTEYINTLSGFDKGYDEQISSDNLIITDASKHENNDNSSPARYYMTFLSGTIVLKKMA